MLHCETTPCLSALRHVITGRIHIKFLKIIISHSQYHEEYIAMTISCAMITAFQTFLFEVASVAYYYMQLLQVLYRYIKL